MPARHRHKRPKRPPPPVPKSPAPFDPETWQLLMTKLRIPLQQARAAELALLDLRNDEIGDRMNVAESTVDSHLNRLYASLNVTGRLGFALLLMALVREEWHLTQEEGESVPRNRDKGNPDKMAPHNAKPIPQAPTYASHGPR